VPPAQAVPWRSAKWEQFSNDAKTVSLAQITHSDRRQFDRLLRLEAKAREMAAPSWYHVPYTHQGRYIKAGWSTHTHEKDRIGSQWQRPPPGEAHLVSVGTLCDPQDPTRAFGIEFEAEYWPAGNGWAARVLYHDYAGAGVFSKVAAVNFVQRGQSNLEGIVVHLPMDRLPQVLATPESLRDLSIAQFEDQFAQLDEELQSFERDLAAGKLQGEEVVLHRGGIPPVTKPRPYTAAEKSKVLAYKTKGVAERRSQAEQRLQSVRSDYQEMYEAMTRAFPLHECW
jgi:hypothetical protein